MLRAGKLVGAAEMPVTKADLVRLMFGQELAPQPRQRAALGETALTLDEVTLRGKRVTVDALDLNMRAGEVVGLAGLDGSGQELIVRACVGLVKPQHGTIQIGGSRPDRQALPRLPARGVAFGAAGRLEEGLIAGLTLTEHVALTSSSDALVNWTAARQATAAQLQLYNVRGTPESQIETLSGGNQQRLLMALMPQRPDPAGA